MQIIGNYVITFILFGLVMYFALPLARKKLAQEQRISKSVWGALLFTIVKVILDTLFP